VHNKGVANLSDSGRTPPTPINHSPLDLAHLDAQTLGDHKLQYELLQLFAAQSPTLVARMHAIGQMDAKILGDLAHHLKGAARAIGAFSVATAAEALEAEPSGRRLAALDAALAAALAAIREHVERIGQPADSTSTGPKG
jgi:HPt (histidine-containing phosphotransfer) domain-containing protein